MEAGGSAGAQPGGTAPMGGQGDAGQGEAQQQGGGEWEGLYGEAVQNAPEELRPHIAEYLKGLEPNFNKPFQDLAETRQQMEAYQPFQEMGLESEDIEGLASFWQMVNLAGQDSNHPDVQQAQDQMYGWWEQVGNELGFFGEDEEGGEGDEGGFDDDPDDPGIVGELETQIQELQQQLQQVQGNTQAQHYERQNAETLAKLASQDGFDFDSPDMQDDLNRIYRLAYAHAEGGDENAIQNAYEDWKAIAGRGQQQLSGVGAEQPGPSLNGGEPNTEPEDIHSWKDASALAKRRLQGG